MVTESMKQAYARLAVRRGVNVQKGQLLVVSAAVQDAAFVRLVVKEAYEAGAGQVVVKWNDEALTKLDFTYQDKETLAEVPQWVHDRTEWEQKKGGCYLHIVSDTPGLLKEMDPQKLRARQEAWSRAMEDLQHYTMANEGQWCVLGMPAPDWAKIVFPDLPEEEAVEKLGDAIFAVSRVREGEDPVAEWEEHDRLLGERAAKLNEYHFDALHFKSGLGTDLTVKLVKKHIWAGGCGKTTGGVVFDPNIPTEEIFCMPERDGVDGIVYASKPLSYRGRVIKNFWFRFENGAVTDCGAEVEEALLKEMLELDEGSKHLGEVALVPYDSPISKSGILFFDTLYDENASCHLALGDAYPENVEGGTDMSEEELKKEGANHSMQHNDFMFGTGDLTVDGILPDGTYVPVFRDGNFVF